VRSIENSVFGSLPLRRSLRLVSLVLAATAAFAPADPVAADAADAILDTKFELFVTDPDESIAFYAVLGFEIAHRQSYGYTTLRNGRAVIALSPVPWWLPLRLASWLRYPPLGTELVFYVADPDSAHAALEGVGHQPGPLIRQPWGHRDFRITDPDGYYLRVSEGTAIPEPGTAARARPRPIE
jgi:catechol 2,3-dioxygenase-like lactoylglutathione lyase family enzyme